MHRKDPKMYYQLGVSEMVSFLLETHKYGLVPN